MPAGCWVRAIVKFESEVVAKQRGPVKRCANHISEDKQSGMISFTIVHNYNFVLPGQLSNAEHFIQCRMDEAVYFMMREHYCVSVPFDKLVGMLCCT